MKIDLAGHYNVNVVVLKQSGELAWLDKALKVPCRTFNRNLMQCSRMAEIKDLIKNMKEQQRSKSQSRLSTNFQVHGAPESS